MSRSLAIDGQAPTTQQVQAVLAVLASCEVGVIGLAVMGENLALNIESRGYPVCVYNRTAARVMDSSQAAPRAGASSAPDAGVLRGRTASAAAHPA